MAVAVSVTIEEGESQMSASKASSSMSRRELLMLIGSVAGSAVSYQAMASMGLVSQSRYKGPIKLEGNPQGASVLILGAGLAGMVAAMELRNAGYKVQVLEYNARVGGRNWSLRGGDTYTELGGFTQKCEFDQGHYLNPGPWRIPSHHHAIMDYCQRLGVALEPFMQVNHNAYVHASNAFGQWRRIGNSNASCRSGRARRKDRWSGGSGRCDSPALPSLVLCRPGHPRDRALGLADRIRQAGPRADPARSPDQLQVPVRLRPG